MVSFKNAFESIFFENDNTIWISCPWLIINYVKESDSKRIPFYKRRWNGYINVSLKANLIPWLWNLLGWLDLGYSFESRLIYNELLGMFFRWDHVSDKIMKSDIYVNLPSSKNIYILHVVVRKILRLAWLKGLRDLLNWPFPLLIKREKRYPLN